MNSIGPEIGPRLKRGTRLLACRQENRMPVEVMSSSHQRVALQFSERPATPFEVAEEFQLNYTDDENILHVFQVEVLRVTGYGRQVEASILGHRMEKRKHRRFEVSLPLCATVVQAQTSDLVGKRFESETQDISLGGLLTMTPLSLTLGDRLELELELAPDERLRTPVWVTRSKMVRNKEFVGAVVIKSSNWLGLEFQLPPDDQLRLLQFLLKRGHDMQQAAKQ